MTDFYQSGIITTLHQLGRPSLERLEGELLEHVRTRPVSLVLPALYSEFEGPAMPRIIEELTKVKYLHQIVLVLGLGDGDAVAGELVALEVEVHEVAAGHALRVDAARPSHPADPRAAHAGLGSGRAR